MIFQKNVALETLNQELCEHILTMNDDMKKLAEEKDTLEGELVKKFEELDENMQSRKYSSRTMVPRKNK